MSLRASDLDRLAPEELRRLIRARLDPLDGQGPDSALSQAPGSDFDLNPDARPERTSTLRAAAVLAPVVWRNPGYGVILTRRADTLASHSGQIAFPGGRLDPGETVVQAAVREAQEEIGLDPGFVEPLALSTPYETVTAYRVTPVVALVQPGFTLKASPFEVADVFEAPLSFLLDRANHRRETLEREGRARSFYAVSYGGHYVWGATAGMLRALSLRLFPDADDEIEGGAVAPAGRMREGE